MAGEEREHAGVCRSEEKVDIAEMYRDVEDHLIPFARLMISDRSVYYHLLRHTRLVGSRTVRIGVKPLSESCSLGDGGTRNALRRLAGKGCIRIVDRGNWGQLVEVMLPSEIPGCLNFQISPLPDLDSSDWFRVGELRRHLLRREKGHCFYCLRTLRGGSEELDHVVPLCKGGKSSYRNIVVSCYDCNHEKMGMSGEEFLLKLYRRNRLTEKEYQERLAMLKAIQKGEMRPEAAS